MHGYVIEAFHNPIPTPVARHNATSSAAFAVLTDAIYPGSSAWFVRDPAAVTTRMRAVTRWMRLPWSGRKGD